MNKAAIKLLSQKLDKPLLYEKTIEAMRNLREEMNRRQVAQSIYVGKI